jgi:hypothetical protein
VFGPEPEPPDPEEERQGRRIFLFWALVWVAVVLTIALVRGLSANNDPSTPTQNGPTALCVDGTVSYSAHHQGTCSHHGGVAQWYR